MQTEINYPAQVRDHIRKTYGTLSVYTNELEGPERTARAVAVTSERIDELLAQWEKDLRNYLDSLLRYTEDEETAQEAARQYQESMQVLERVVANRQKMAQIKDEAVHLGLDAKKLRADAAALADCRKVAAIRVSRMIDLFLSAR